MDGITFDFIDNITDIELLKDVEKTIQLKRGELSKLENHVRRKKKQLEKLTKL